MSKKKLSSLEDLGGFVFSTNTNSWGWATWKDRWENVDWEVKDYEQFKKDLMLAALTNPSNSDIYTTQYAHFVETFGRVGIPSYLPNAFFIAGGSLAIENALKVAMDWKVQKNFQKGHKEEKGFKILHFEQAFHGRSGYTLSLTNTLPDKTKWFAKFDWPRVSNPKIKFPLTPESIADVEQRC